MQLTVTGHHIDVTPALRAYVTEKMQRVTRHFEHVISVHAVLGIEKHEQQAEATINVAGGGKAIFATESAMDMYAAIDGLVDKLDRQVRRHKEKLTDHHRSQRHAAAG